MTHGMISFQLTMMSPAGVRVSMMQLTKCQHLLECDMVTLLTLEDQLSITRDYSNTQFSLYSVFIVLLAILMTKC